MERQFLKSFLSGDKTLHPLDAEVMPNIYGGAIDVKHTVEEHWIHILEGVAALAMASLFYCYRKDIFNFGKKLSSPHGNNVANAHKIKGSFANTKEAHLPSEIDPNKLNIKTPESSPRSSGLRNPLEFVEERKDNDLKECYEKVYMADERFESGTYFDGKKTYTSQQPGFTALKPPFIRIDDIFRDPKKSAKERLNAVRERYNLLVPEHERIAASSHNVKDELTAHSLRTQSLSSKELRLEQPRPCTDLCEGFQSGPGYFYKLSNEGKPEIFELLEGECHNLDGYVNVSDMITTYPTGKANFREQTLNEMKERYQAALSKRTLNTAHTNEIKEAIHQ